MYAVFMLLRGAAQNPTHVRPPASVSRRVWIAGVIGVRMMNAMRDYPIDRSAFQCQQATEGQKVFDRLRCFITTMRQQPMETHANPQASGNPPKQQGNRNDFPANTLSIKRDAMAPA